MTDPAISNQYKVSVTHYIKKTLKNLNKQLATFCNYVSINKPKFGKVNPNDCSQSYFAAVFQSHFNLFFQVSYKYLKVTWYIPKHDSRYTQ